MSPRRVGALLLVLAATLVAGCDVLPGRDSESGFVPQADALSAQPPATGSDAALRGYASCSTAADEFVGDEWPAGRLMLHLVLPTADGWAAAERWYRCCYNPTFDGDEIRTLPPASCTGPHQSEFAGVWWTDDVPAGDEVTRDHMTDGCTGEIARYVGVGNEQEVRRRGDVLHLPPTEDEAAAGATYVLCLLHTDGRPLTRSLPGVGVRGLPPPR